MIAATISVIALGTILLMTVSVDVQYSSDGVKISGKIGPFKIQRPQKKDYVEPENPEKSGSEENREKKPDRKLNFAELMRHKTLILNTLGRLRRKLSIDYFLIHFTAASSDPYHTAVQFGAANAVMGIITAVLHGGFKVREHDIKAGLDYNINSPALCVRIKVSIACWELVYVITALGTEILNSMYRSR